jgi:hypothetical protein
MSQAVCLRAPTPASYPPVRADNPALVAELNRQRELAPFGRAKNGAPMPEGHYIRAVEGRMRAATRVDYRWPFWGGLLLGAAGIAILAVKR